MNHFEILAHLTGNRSCKPTEGLEAFVRIGFRHSSLEPALQSPGADLILVCHADFTEFGTWSFSAAISVDTASGQIPAPGSFASSAFPVPPNKSSKTAPKIFRASSKKHPLALEAVSTRLSGCPNYKGRNGAKIMHIYVKWNSFRCSSLADVSDIRAWFVLRWPLPVAKTCDAGGGALRSERREWPGTDYWANLVR